MGYKHRRNFRGEFIVRLHLADRKGNIIGWPGWNWRAEFRTSQFSRAFTAERKGWRILNCTDDHGSILVAFDRHGLYPGELTVDFTAQLPNPAYPDGFRRIQVKQETDIMLVPDTCSEDPRDVIDVTLILPAEAAELVAGWDDQTPKEECCESLTEEEINDILEEVGGITTPGTQRPDDKPQTPDRPSSGCECECEPMESFSEEDIQGIINEVVNGH